MPSYRARFAILPLVFGCGMGFFAPPLTVRAQTPAPLPPVAPISAKTGSLQNKTFVLRWLKPSEFVRQVVPPTTSDTKPALFTLPPGVTQLSPDDPKNRVFIQGTPEAVAQMESVARLMDVEPRRVQLTLRIFRAPVNAVIKPGSAFSKSDVISTAVVSGVSNQAQMFQAIGDGQLFRVEITPHVNGDNTVALQASFSEIAASSLTSAVPTKNEPANGQIQKDVRLVSRRVVNGGTIVAVSLPDRKKPNLAYYLEVTPLADAPRQNP